MDRARPRTASLLALVAALLVVIPVADAAPESKEVKLSGMGVRKCSDWLQWKEAQNLESRAMTLEWAQGFMAGHNVYARGAGGSSGSVVAGVAVLIPLLDAYCQKNPGERILAGVIEITKELGGTKVDLTPKSPAAPANPLPRKDEKGRQES